MQVINRDKIPASVGKKPTTPGKTILAGGTAGAIEAIVMFPTEFVKTQLQLQNKQNPKFTGPWNCAVVTVREYGVFGLYRGLSVLLFGSIPKAAVRFTIYELLSGYFKDAEGKLSFGKIILSGLGAGVGEAILAVGPMETIKTRLIHDQNAPPEKRKYKGLVHGVSTIFKNEGIAGIYKGLAPTILKQGTNQATRFLVFEELKTIYTGGDPSVDLPIWARLIAGATAGAASVFVNNPIDVVKTKMQGLEAKMYKNSLDCAISIWKNQGPLFFYRGALPRLARVCGDTAIVFAIYDKLVDFYTALEKKVFGPK